jgi:hypothetical protein
MPGSSHSIIIYAQDCPEAMLEFSIPADDLVISPTDILGTIFKGSLTKFIIARILDGDNYHASNFLFLVRESSPPLL